MSKYETPASNFDGLKVKPRPDQATHICPLCKGHGRWNHQLNVYAGYADSPHPHSTHYCPDCNGSGWKWELHNHHWQEVEMRNCFYRYTCTICGKTKDIDSGG